MVHHKNRHREVNHDPVPHLNTSYMQSYPQHLQLETSYMHGYPQYIPATQNNYLQNESAQSVSMETDGHPQDFLSESDSEESEIDDGCELGDIITDIDVYYSYTRILSF